MIRGVLGQSNSYPCAEKKMVGWRQNLYPLALACKGVPITPANPRLVMWGVGISLDSRPHLLLVMRVAYRDY